MAEKIGFVGVGRMGANMARHLVDVGFPVVAVYDIQQELVRAIARELGAEACATLARVTELADIIFTVVSDDKSMLKIFSPPKNKADTLLLGARDKLFVNCATITPKVHRQVQQSVIRAGAEAIEACMASSITQARQGSLYLMCGGDQRGFERAKPILEKLSASMRFIGPAGSAAEVKALVNMVMNMNTAALAEGLALGAALKIDLKMLREVFAQTGAASRVLETDGEDMQNREHTCYFSAEHAAKDSGIALALAEEKGLKVPLATATRKQYVRMVKEGLGHLDKSGISELTFKGRHKSGSGRVQAPSPRRTGRGRG